jgi:Carboxypeptidase regulatory-like domain
MVKRPLSKVIVAAGALILLSSALSAQMRKLEPFTVSGTVLDTKGRPLKNARVWIKPDFVYGRSEVSTNAEGRYIVRNLLKATYRAFAYTEVVFNSKKSCVRLAMPNPDDYNSFAVDQGSQRNFRWQLTGKVGREDTHFGATIRLANTSGYYATTRSIELTLTPTGPLIDGSTGKVIVREVSLEPPASDDALNDIPIGLYQLRAVQIGKDGGRTPIRIGTNPAETAQSTLETDWRSTNRCGFGSDSGVEPFLVQLETPK